MFLRAKTLRRLAALLLIALLIAGVAMFYYERNKRLRREQLARDATDGVAAYHAGDFPLAISKLGRVLRQRPGFDRDVTFSYAMSRSQVVKRDNSHLIDAVTKLKEILARLPDDLEAAHALLDLYRKTGSSDELLKLADAVLRDHAVDPETLQARSVALAQTYRYDEALKTNLAYNAVVPNDLNSQVLTLTLFSRSKRSPSEIIAHAKKLKAERPNDPRYDLLLAVAYQSAGDTESAVKFLDAAAATPLADVVFVRHLAACYDQLKQFDKSRALIEAAVQTTGDLSMRRLLAQRLWQRGENAEILARFGTEPPEGDEHLLAYRALALYQTQQPEPAKALVATLRARAKDRPARAWAMAIDARFEKRDAPRTEVVDALSSARNLDPQNAVFDAWLGDAYFELGEYVSAARSWSAASDKAPGWVAPLVGKSAALLAVGRTNDAVAAAESAFRLLPDLASACNLAVLRFRQLEETPDAVRAAELLDLVERINAQNPGEPRVIHVRAALLARAGRRAEAADIIRAALAKPGAYDTATLMRLTAVDREENLNVDTAAATANVTPTPDWTLTQAARLADAGDVAGGAKLLEDAADKAPADQQLAWVVARARYASATGDATAAAQWTALSEAHPNDLAVQQAVLAAVSPTADRALFSDAVDRVKNITGESGHQWQIAKARLLLATPEAAQREAAGREAVAVLSNVVREAPGQAEPRLLLAAALEQTGQVGSATQHLRSVLASDPRNPQAVIELVRLLNDSGKQDEARDVLRKLATDTLLSGRQRLLIASAMAEAGERGRAIELLERARQKQSLDPAGLQLLAETLAAVGRSEQAARVYGELLDQRNVRPGAVVSAAEFFAASGDPAEARVLLQRLSSLKLAPGRFDLVAGRFEERFGTAEKALAHYRAAAATGTVIGHAALVEYFLRGNHLTEAQAAAESAVQAHPKEPALARLKLEADALARAQGKDGDLTPLIDVLAADPARAAEADTLRAVRDSAGATDAQKLAVLRNVADKYPRFLPVQEKVVAGYLSARQPGEAADIARRAMVTLPNDPDAARLAFTAARAAKRWPAALAAARAWKERATGDAFGPDCALAEASLENGDIAAARKLITPHIDAISGTTPRDIAARGLFARVMAKGNEEPAAFDMIAPALADPAGRAEAVRIARDELGRAEDVSRWLDHVSESVATDAERRSVALAWSDAGVRLDSQLLLTRSASLLTADDAETQYRLAQVRLRLDQPAEAEAALRAVLSKQTDQADAANDLAFVLLARRGDLTEAMRLAEQAVAAAPGEARFHDTLARVRLAAGDKVGAKSSFERALQLEPNQIDALVGYAGLLSANGDRDGAARLLDRADAVLALDPAAARRFRTEVGDLRQTLTKTTD